MAPSMSPETVPATDSLHRTERLVFERRLWRRDMFRRGVIVVVAASASTLVLAVSFVAGRHLVTSWWLESLHGGVVWEINETNWRQGGETVVDLRMVRQSDLRLGDLDLTHVRNLHRVVSLNLSENDRITDDGLVELRGLDSLTALNLERLDRYRPPHSGSVARPLTDACLVHVLALPRLEILTLSGNLITDQGLAQIAKMDTLKVLDLDATEITDAGLAYIKAMKGLETVNLGATRVTKGAATQLQMVRPDLRIDFDTDPSVEATLAHTRGTAQ